VTAIPNISMLTVGVIQSLVYQRSLGNASI